MLTHSIRWRLQLWLAFLLVCVLTGFGLAAYDLLRINQFRQIDEELEKRIGALSSSLREHPRMDHGHPGPPHENEDHRPPPPPDGFGPPDDGSPGADRPPRPNQSLELTAQAESLFNQSQSNSYYFCSWFRDGRAMKNSSNAPSGVLPPDFQRDTRIRFRTDDLRREAFHFTELGDCLVVGRNISGDLKALHSVKWILFSAGAVILIFGIAVGWQLTNRSLRPLETISAAAQRIAGGNLSERIPVETPGNEISELAAILNSTFSQLESVFNRQKQFTADAAHELRTPLAVLITEAQTTLARERPAAEYRETVGASLEIAQQMRGLTESLLQLARFDAGVDHASRTRVDVAAIAQECVQQLRPIAGQREIQIHADLTEAKTSSQPERIKQVLMNLLANAIHYNKPNGEIRVTCGEENNFAIVTVSDTGIGISREDLPHIFERFYRADKSRSKAAGRYGLGLAICHSIVTAEGGTIEASSQPGNGSKFTVRWRV